MKLAFKFIGNACGVFEGSQGTKILCDPWLVPGVFDGSWAHYPPITTTPETLQEIDAIYLSHLHPDHFDERYFTFRKTIPIIALNHGHNFLIKKLLSLGYINIIEGRDKEKFKFKEFEITLYAPFTKVSFHDAEVGNLLDSAMHIECEGISALNANDNTLTLDACKWLPTPTLAMMNYNAAGPYPSCFENLSPKQKQNEAEAIIRRNFEHLALCSHALKPKFILPFAGAYCLEGSLSHKNPYLGTTTWEECAHYLLYKTESKAVLMRENDVLDIETGICDKHYVPIEPRTIRPDVKYPYQLDLVPDSRLLVSSVETASYLMKKRMEKLGILSAYAVYLTVFKKQYQIYPEFKWAPVPDYTRLECEMDERLLRRILDRKSHWNNAEIGCHISFYRNPNVYDPDLHTGLQFFHL